METSSLQTKNYTVNPESVRWTLQKYIVHSTQYQEVQAQYK